jgi:hypothetical protein
MPPLVTRILLTILMLPFASLVYMSAYVLFERRSPVVNPDALLIASGIVSWIFIVIYWCIVWRRAVHPSSFARVGQMLAAVLIAAAGGIGIGWFLDAFTSSAVTAALIGSIAAPLIWLTAVILLWLESPSERELRLRNASTTILCPVCGYNLTGLDTTRCPECGRHFTIDELLAKQANRAKEIESAD